jgi:hypothetical protein
MTMVSAKSAIMGHWKPGTIFSGAAVSADNAGNQLTSHWMTVYNFLR